MIHKLIGALARAMMSCLSIDILYLYYAGAWQEPRQFILVSELVGLYAISVMGLVWAIHYVLKR
jgi:hypothetical protein